MVPTLSVMVVPVTLHPLTVEQMLEQELVEPASINVQLLVQCETVDALQLEAEAEDVIV